MKTITKLFIFIFTFLSLTASASAESPREQFKQMVEQLQASPNDDALREKIITLAATLKPAPALPQEAERFEGRAQFAFKNAKSSADYLDVAREYEKAIAAAPWVAGYYSDLCTIYEKAEKYAEAKQSCEFFLASAPSALDASDARKRIAGLEFAMEKSQTIRKAEAEMRPGKVFRDCPDCPEMVILPAGNIAMGKYEVTQGQWRAVMGNNPSRFKNCGDTCPVEQVSWNDAKDFIQRLNSKTGKQYRLPTEAEWEYACRGGAHQEYCGSDSVDSVAWYYGNSGSTTHPVGRKQANAFGLHDMSGNVWEFVEDCLNGDCASRVVRGGSWLNDPRGTRAAGRARNGPASRDIDNGFRLARMLP